MYIENIEREKEHMKKQWPTELHFVRELRLVYRICTKFGNKFDAPSNIKS